jgi:hypothetical protein
MTADTEHPRAQSAFDWQRPALGLGLICLALHLFANGNYGFFRDELYFIVCGRHPAFGYVDQPPLVPLLAASAYWLGGGILVLFRLLPALVMAATVALTAKFTQALGGGRYAQWLAGLCLLLSPYFLLSGVLFTTDMFQAVSLLGIVWMLVRLEQTPQEWRWWLLIGVVTGLALQTKYAIAFFVVALIFGLLLTRERRLFLRPWVYVAALIASVILLPNVLWQQAHHWPFLQLGQAGVAGKNQALSPFAFFKQQILLVGPLAMIVVLCGLGAGALKPRFATLRAAVIAWVLLFATFDALHGKAYYLSPIYPVLIALGAARLEAWLHDLRLRALLLGAVAIAGSVTLPLTLPILPVPLLIRYIHTLGLMPSSGERLKIGALPQYDADMFGWRQMAAKVAKVYWALPPKERAHAVFFGNNYGEAAAIDVFGRRLGLPPAISGHNNYYLWGPRGHTGRVIIIIGGSRKHYAKLFRSYQEAGFITARYAMPYETDRPIYVLCGLKGSLERYWPKLKHYE